MADDTAFREKLRELLGQGLRTRVEPVPRDNLEFDAIVGELLDLDDHQLEEKLILAGFVGRPHGKNGQRCSECMYYSQHRKWCVLPQLDLPVEPEWWCRLWRV